MLRTDNLLQNDTREPAGARAAARVAPPALKPVGLLGDDAVSLSNTTGGEKLPISMREYKEGVAKDQSFVRDTLRHKLSEYQLAPHTRIELGRNLYGKMEVRANMPAAVKEKIERDLNQNTALRDAFNRLSQEKPTLDYVANVVNVSKAYGVTNPLFKSLVSQDQSHNRLSDLSLRYQNLRQTVAANQPDIASGLSDLSAPAFSVLVNG